MGGANSFPNPPSFFLCFPLGEGESQPALPGASTRAIPGLSEEVTLFPLQVQTFTPENLLFVSTLDGSLHALIKKTGDLKWTLKDGKQGQSLLPPWISRWGEVTLAWTMRTWGLESNKQVSAGIFTTYQLCDFGKVTSPL